MRLKRGIIEWKPTKWAARGRPTSIIELRRFLRHNHVMMVHHMMMTLHHHAALTVLHHVLVAHFHAPFHRLGMTHMVHPGRMNGFVHVHRCRAMRCLGRTHRTRRRGGLGACRRSDQAKRSNRSQNGQTFHHQISISPHG